MRKTRFFCVFLIVLLATSFLSPLLILKVNAQPSLGYETKGGSSGNGGANYLYLSRFTASGSGSVTALKMYVKQYGSTHPDFKFCIYGDDGDGTPGALLGYTVEETMSQGQDGWLELAIDGSAVSVTDGNYYHLGFFSEGIVTYYYNALGGGNIWSFGSVPAGYPNFPNPTTIYPSYDRAMSIYAVFAAGGTETEVSSAITLTPGFNGNLAWTFLKEQTMPFELAINGLDFMAKTSLSTLALTFTFTGLNTYASDRLSTIPLEFGVNGLKTVAWQPLTSIPFSLDFFGTFASAILNFLNIFSSIDLTASLSWLGAFAFGNGFTATLTFMSNGLKAAAFQLGNQLGLSVGLDSVFSTLTVTLLNIFGSVNLNVVVNALRAFSFEWLATAPFTLSFTAIVDFVSAALMNVFGSVGLGFTVNALRAFSFDWLATVPLAFGFNAFADFLSQTFLNIAGSVPVTFALSLGKVFEFMFGGSISAVLGFAGSITFAGLPTLLNIFGSIFLGLGFAGEFPFGEWLTTQFDQWFIMGAVIFGLIVGTLVFSIMRLRRKEED